MADIDKKELTDIISKSDFTSDIELKENDKLITLSTCAYEYDGARYVVIGILKEIS